MALSAGEITALAGSIVGEFINKLPQIVTGVKNIQNQQSGGGNGRRNGIDDLSNDFERVIVNRMKRERDVNDKLYELIKERAKELKTLKSYNEELKQIVSQTGTYNNMSQLIVKTLTDKIHNTANTQDKTIGGIQKVRVSLDGIVNDFSNLMNTIEKGNRTTLGSLTDFVKTDFSKSLADLAKEVADNSALGSSADASALRKLAEKLKTSTTLGPQTDSRNLGAQLIKHLGPILASINANIQQFDTMNNELFKQSKINKITASELNQNLELMADYQSTLGDISGEMKGLDEIKKLQSRLNVLTQDYNKTENKTADVISEFNKQQKGLFDLLTPLVEMNIKTLKDEAKKQAREQDRQKIINAIREGFQTGPGSDSFVKQIEDKISNAGKLLEHTPFGSMLAKAGKMAMSAIVPALKEIENDQLAVAKYGIHMKDDGILGNSWSSNISKAAGMWLSGAQLAEYLGSNRVMGASMGGQSQLTKLLTQTLGTEATKGGESFQFNGKKAFFSELIGGTKQYQAETVLGISNMLQRSGLAANHSSFQNQLSTRKGSLYDTAFQTGQLPKDLAAFMESMTDSTAYNAELVKMNPEQLDAQLDLISNLQTLGAKMGMSIQATQQMTKQMYESSRNVSAEDRLKAGPIANVLTSILGINDPTGIFSRMSAASGKQRADIWSKSSVGERQTFKNIEDALQAALNDSTGNNFNNEIIRQTMAHSSQVSGLVDQMSGLTNVSLNKLPEKGIDSSQANNFDINREVSTAVSNYAIFKEAIANGPVHLTEYLRGMGGSLMEWLGVELEDGGGLHTQQVNLFTNKVQAQEARDEAVFQNGLLATKLKEMQFANSQNQLKTTGFFGNDLALSHGLIGTQQLNFNNLLPVETNYSAKYAEMVATAAKDQNSITVPSERLKAANVLENARTQASEERRQLLEAIHLLKLQGAEKTSMDRLADAINASMEKGKRVEEAMKVAPQTMKLNNH